MRALNGLARIVGTLAVLPFLVAGTVLGIAWGFFVVGFVDCPGPVTEWMHGGKVKPVREVACYRTKRPGYEPSDWITGEPSAAMVEHARTEGLTIELAYREGGAA